MSLFQIVWVYASINLECSSIRAYIQSTYKCHTDSHNRSIVLQLYKHTDLSSSSKFPLAMAKCSLESYIFDYMTVMIQKLYTFSLTDEPINMWITWQNIHLCWSGGHSFEKMLCNHALSRQNLSYYWHIMFGTCLTWNTSRKCYIWMLNLEINLLEPMGKYMMVVDICLTSLSHVCLSLATWDQSIDLQEK